MPPRRTDPISRCQRHIDAVYPCAGSLSLLAFPPFWNRHIDQLLVA